MTTESIIIKRIFYEFDESVSSPITNPRPKVQISVKILPTGNLAKQIVSDYDLEVYRNSDIADIFCNIKTQLIWNITFAKESDINSISFAESLIYHIISQINFTASILREEHSDFLGLSNFMIKPNPKQIYDDLQKEFKNLTNQAVINPDYSFLFKNWYSR